jgi:hypothetical protein
MKRICEWENTIVIGTEAVGFLQTRALVKKRTHHNVANKSTSMTRDIFFLVSKETVSTV